METLLKVLESNLVVGFILLVVVVPLYVKLGLFKKNGNGVSAKLEEIESNHLSHIEAKLDKLIEISQRTLFILEERKK